MFLEFLGLRRLLLQGGMINIILQKIGFGEVKYFYSALGCIEGVIKMAEFINSEIKYVALGEATGVTLPPPIATVKFDVRIPGRFTIDVNEDGSWTYVRERYDEEWRRKHFEVSYNQGFLDGWKAHEKKKQP